MSGESNGSVVDFKEYLTLLKGIVQEGKEASMVITGNSMSPFLYHGRDRIFFSKPEEELRVGDMVFFQRENGQFVMHRIQKIKKEGYYIVGDRQTNIEGPIRREQIFAKVTRVMRKGKWCSEGDFWWDFFAKVWIHMVWLRKPVIGIVFPLYGRLHKKREQR